jgi:hypothetical protein
VVGVEGMVAGLDVTPQPANIDKAEAAPNPYKTSRLVNLGVNKLFLPDSLTTLMPHSRQRKWPPYSYLSAEFVRGG